MKKFDDDFEVAFEADEVLDTLSAIIKELETAPLKANEEQEKLVRIVYSIMKQFTKGRNVQVTYKLHDPYFWSGDVIVVGKDIEVMNPQMFASAINLSDNFEVYTKVDGTVVMGFGFNHLADLKED